MSKNTALYIPRLQKIVNATFTSSDGTTAKTVYTCPSDGANLLGFMISSDDTVSNDVIFTLNANNASSSAIDVVIGYVNVPANAGRGNSSVASIKSMSYISNLLDTYGNYILPLEGSILKIGMRLTVSSTKTIGISLVIAEY